MREKGFDILISSDIEYEELCAEIYFDGQFVAIITQEKGIDQAVIELYPHPNLEKWTFIYAEFFETLKKAETSLKKMKKIEPEN
jgi:phage pi2 protein 07